MRHKSVQLARCSVAATSRVREATVAPRIALHIRIGRLTMQGYSPAQQKRFTRALQFSLGELAERGGAGQWSAARALRMNRLDAGRLPAGATPEAAARQIATRLFAGLTQAQATGRSTRGSREEDHA